MALRGPGCRPPRGYDGPRMPIYEFRCEGCGERFEGLFPAGTEAAPCPECGSERTRRVLSAPGPPPHLVKTPREARKQEGRNAKLREGTQARFKAARQRARERAARRRGSP
jgi:putative FmdB family regulatory protein